MNLPDFTWIYLNVPVFTWIYHLRSIGFTWVDLGWSVSFGIKWVILEAWEMLRQTDRQTHTHTEDFYYALHWDPFGSNNALLTTVFVEQALTLLRTENHFAQHSCRASLQGWLSYEVYLQFSNKLCCKCLLSWAIQQSHSCQFEMLDSQSLYITVPATK